MLRREVQCALPLKVNDRFRLDIHIGTNVNRPRRSSPATMQHSPIVDCEQNTKRVPF
jgi:hypothetical protein